MFESIYFKIFIAGIVFNFASLFLSVAYHSLFPLHEQMALLGKVKKNKAPFKTRLVYLIPYSVGFYILFTMYSNTVWLNKRS